MAAQHLINIDLATIKIPATETEDATSRVLAWGDEVEVLNAAELAKKTAEHVEIKVTIYRTLEDGSVKPAHVVGFIKPPKSSGIKPADVVIEKKHSRVLA